MGKQYARVRPTRAVSRHFSDCHSPSIQGWEKYPQARFPNPPCCWDSFIKLTVAFLFDSTPTPIPSKLFHSRGTPGPAHVHTKSLGSTAAVGDSPRTQLNS